jgi:AcrR family transcriptional regulator
VLLGAAVKVFARKGFHASRVGDIAEEAGVAHGLLYHYFDSKDAVLETIFRETWSELLDAVRRVEENDATPVEQLREVAVILLRSWDRDPDLVRVLVREVTRSGEVERLATEIREAFTAIERIVRRGQESGDLRADLDPGLASTIFYGAIEEVLTGWVLGLLPDGEEGVARAETAVAEIVLSGLATPVSAAQRR